MSVCKNHLQVWVWECPICGRVEKLEGSVRDTQETLMDLGWKQTTQLSEDGSRVLVCSSHFRAGGYTLYNHDGQRIRTEDWDL